MKRLPLNFNALNIEPENILKVDSPLLGEGKFDVVKLRRIRTLGHLVAAKFSKSRQTLIDNEINFMMTRLMEYLHLHLQYTNSILLTPMTAFNGSTSPKS